VPLFLLACCAALGLVASSGLLRSHAQSAPAPTVAVPQKVASAPAPAVGQQGRPPAANNPEDAQKQQIASECADLLKMATELKSEVDKTNRDTLSVAVVRKASAIEQLAHKVRTGNTQGSR
jgi:type VI protein secretion system component VasF